MKNLYAYLCMFLCFDLFATMIAPTDKALTLSQVKIDNQVHTLLVISMDDTSIKAIDVSKKMEFYPNYSLDIFKGSKDFSYFLDLINNYSNQAQSYTLSELLPATHINNKHIGAAGNYPEHANETSLDPNNVFIFPKIGEIHPTNSSIEVGKKALLDYEVELCATFDRNIVEMKDFEQSIIGLFVCNDWSDRSFIVRNFDSNHPELAGGLTDAKSQPGYYSGGSLMVVPYDLNSFVKEIDLSLLLNGETKQNQNASKMILSIQDLVQMTLDRGSNLDWYLGGENISIIPSGYIEKGMTLLTGTPEGVIFRPPSASLKLGYAARYIFSGILGPFYHQSITDYIREKYVKKLIRKKVFLQPGDNIISSATYMGSIQTKIIEKNK